MSMIENPMLRLLGRFLDVAAARHGVIATNVANIDTPGYHTRDLDFQAELHRAVTANGRTGEPHVHEVGGLIHRPDGNDVSLERETLMLAQTQLQFRTGVQLLRAEFRRLMTAINEGKGV